MPRTMSATEARVHFGELIRLVQAGETVIVERRGKPVAVFIHPDEFARLKAAHPNWDETIRRFRESKAKAAALARAK